MKNFYMVSIALMALLVLNVRVRAEDKPASQPATQPANTFEASDFDALKAADGKDAVVHGKVSRAGWYQDRILFINFEGVDRNGFTAIVRSDHKDAVKDFGDGADLTGKEVNITGKIKLYRDKPEIEITKPDQIKVLASADSDKDKDKDQDKDKKTDADKKEQPQPAER